MTLVTKKIIPLLLVCILLISNVYALVTPTKEFFVNDYANLLSQTTKDYIVNVNTSLQSQTDAQVVVVTVPNLEGRPIEEYATDLYRSFGIGDKTKNNGVLLLLALEEREFRVEVGYGLEGALNDAKTGRIQDQYIIPYLKENKWNDGIKNGFDAIIEEICKEYEITVTSDKAVPLATNGTELNGNFTWILGIGFFIGAACGIAVKIKKIKVLPALGIMAAVMAVMAIVLWVIVKVMIIALIIVGINAIIMIITFAFVCSGATIRIGPGGGFSSGGGSSSSPRYYGGGGRSGGGGSTRKF